MDKPAMKMFSFTALLFALALPVNAQETAVTQGKDLGGIVFLEIEKRLIRNIYGIPSSERDPERWRPRNEKAHTSDIFESMHTSGKKFKLKMGKDRKGTSPGLAKRNKLPPGLAKFKKLPKKLKKRPRPKGLEDILPPRKMTERVIVGNHVVLVEKATNLVLDILKGVIRNAVK